SGAKCGWHDHDDANDNAKVCSERHAHKPSSCRLPQAAEQLIRSCTARPSTIVCGLSRPLRDPAWLSLSIPHTAHSSRKFDRSKEERISGKRLRFCAAYDLLE